METSVIDIIYLKLNTEYNCLIIGTFGYNSMGKIFYTYVGFIYAMCGQDNIHN